jgi:aspartate carbamoyltransferase regulatory subunit
MALLAAILGVSDVKVARDAAAERRPPKHVTVPDVTCSNPRCVTTQERYLGPLFESVGATGRKLRCAYCEHITVIPQEASA